MNKNVSLRQTLKVLELKESMGIGCCQYLYTFIHILQSNTNFIFIANYINFWKQQKMGNGQCASVHNCTFVCEEEQAITSNVRILKVEDMKNEQEPHLISFSKISLSNTSNSKVNNSFAITPGEQSKITSLHEIANSNIKKSLNHSKGQSTALFVNIEIIDKISIKEFYDLKKLVKNVQLTIKQLMVPRSYIIFQQATEELIQKQKFVKLKFNPTEQNQTCFFRGSILDKNQKRVLEGYGELYFNNGAYYNGNLKYNQFSDKGLYIHPDKDYYFGTWKSNSAHGKGDFRHYQGVLYTGQWVYDQQQGYGEQYWPDGAVFKGFFKKGHKRKGRFSWPNKSSYEGEFVNDQFEGEGQFLWEDNRSYKGTWKANKMHGFGTFSWPNGQTFTGQYEADKKNGNGELALNDGTVVKGKWLNGKLNGMSEICKNGYVTKVWWKDGVEVKP